MSDIAKAARSDPIGAGIVVCAVALLTAVAVYLMPPVEIELGAYWPTMPDWRQWTIPRPWKAAQPGPAKWLAAAHPDDVLAVPGYPVAFWGDPNARYGSDASSRRQAPVAVVVHYTAPRALLNMVRYGHSGDAQRGGASYGYHVYVDRDGRIAQGAPLGRRTNHVKPVGHNERKPYGSHVWNANSVSVSMVGGCALRPGSAITERCSREDLSHEQLEAGLAVVLALMKRFGIPCTSVYGHGELQKDREPFEGFTIATEIRECADVSLPGP